MFKSAFIAVIGAVVTLGSIATPASAQLSPRTEPTIAGFRNDRRDLERMDREMVFLRENTERHRNDIAAAPTPEEAIVASQALATSAGLSCQVTEANFLGRASEDAYTYEAACASGPGYILIDSTPPQSMDCMLLAGQAETDRARDPNADVGAQCTIPQNTDVLRVLTSYAADAGIGCAVNQGTSIGRAGDNLVYEVGCNGADGYWLERQPTGWKKTECAVVLTQGSTCRYSDAAEQAATLKTRIADTEADACDVTESRFMGTAGPSTFYEAKCGAGGGYVVRFSPSFAVQQVYPCEQAQRIGGGCRLTVVAAGAPATQP